MWGDVGLSLPRGTACSESEGEAPVVVKSKCGTVLHLPLGRRRPPLPPPPLRRALPLAQRRAARGARCAEMRRDAPRCAPPPSAESPRAPRVHGSQAHDPGEVYLLLMQSGASVSSAVPLLAAAYALPWDAPLLPHALAQLRTSHARCTRPASPPPRGRLTAPHAAAALGRHPRRGRRAGSARARRAGGCGGGGGRGGARGGGGGRCGGGGEGRGGRRGGRRSELVRLGRLPARRGRGRGRLRWGRVHRGRLDAGGSAAGRGGGGGGA